MKKLVFVVIAVFLALFFTMIIATANVLESAKAEEATPEEPLGPAALTLLAKQSDPDAVLAGILAHLDDWQKAGGDYAGDPYLVLVNKEHPLPTNWTDLIVLDDAKNSLGEDFKVEHEALQQFFALREELLKEGVDIELDSTYRTPDAQKAIWEDWLYSEGVDYCLKYLAFPGYSEHQTGLAIDIFILRGEEQIRDNDDMLADVADFGKIHARLAEFGFILRYLPGAKEEITGYGYEPWHLRYVGSPELAAEIMTRRLTLEEYLAGK